MKKKNPWEKEWDGLIKAEARYTGRRKDGPTSVLMMKLDRFVPKKLSGTLNAAFAKAFIVIFNKGTPIIEKTYNRRKKQADFKIDKFAHELMNDRKTAHSFTKRANGTKLLNISISFVEGVLMGLLGLSIPDIPLFIGLVIKSVYEVAITYGYDYHDEDEKVFLLKLIEVAMMDEDAFLEGDRQINEAIAFIAENNDEIGGWSISKEEQIKLTAESLAKEMLYTKFIQGYFLVGIAGGVFDPVYVNRVCNYAALKYRRRFLSKHLREKERQPFSASEK